MECSGENGAVAGTVVADPLPADQVELSWVALDTLTPTQVAQLALLLEPSEQERVGRLRVEARRRESTVAWGMLRLLLSGRAPVLPSAWRFSRTRLGKPYVTEPAGFVDLRFSLSHTDGLVAWALGRDREVGVDAERLSASADVESVWQHALTDAERTEVQRRTGAEQAYAFFSRWTLKESYLKACGTGLSGSLKSVAFPAVGPGVVQACFSNGSSSSDPNDQWYFASFVAGDHCIGLCVTRQPQESIRVVCRSMRSSDLTLLLRALARDPFPESAP